MVRLFFALTAAGGRRFTQVDVKTAFLTAPLDIELDVILPTGFGRKGEVDDFSSPESRRRRALTAIPGCPQGSRAWREKLVRDLSSLGYSVFCATEQCLFKDMDSDPVWLVVWVDDVLISSPCNASGDRRRDAFIAGMRRLYPHGLKVSAENAVLFHCLGLIIERLGTFAIYGYTNDLTCSNCCSNLGSVMVQGTPQRSLSLRRSS